MNQSNVTLTPQRRLIRLLAGYRREIRYIFLYALVAGLINLSLPLGVQAIIGLIAGGAINVSWGVLVFFIVLGALLTGLLRLMQLSVMEYMQRQIFTNSALEFAARIPRFNLEMLRREHIPELMNRFFDTLTLQKGLPKMLMDGATAVLQILFSLLLLSFYHASFVSFSLLLMAVLMVLFYWTGPQGLETSLKESKYKYKLVFWLEEVGRVAATFKLAGNNFFPMKRADQLTLDYLKARRKHWRILLIQFASSVAFRALTLGGFLVLGSILVMENQLNLGQFVASEILILFVIDSVDKLILLHETAYDVLTATEKLGSVSDLPVEREDGIPVEEFCHEEALAFEMRGLGYQYEDGEYPILEDINLKVGAGERVAIAGYNASGKSTLMQIISVLRRDFTGSLMFNGLPKQNLNLRSLREKIGDVSSQEDIFKGSILENITLGREDVGLAQVLEVCEVLGLTAFIRQAPNGIDTELLPGGKNIAGSIVTKILVARAVVGKPKLLAMEEPLGKLNAAERLRIASYLTHPNKPWTLVCVTEDPLLASLCDRTVVLREGKIIFDGDFATLRRTPHFDRIFKVDETSNQPE